MSEVPENKRFDPLNPIHSTQTVNVDTASADQVHRMNAQTKAEQAQKDAVQKGIDALQKCASDVQKMLLNEDGRKPYVRIQNEGIMITTGSDKALIVEDYTRHPIQVDLIDDANKRTWTLLPAPGRDGTMSTIKWRFPTLAEVKNLNARANLFEANSMTTVSKIVKIAGKNILTTTGYSSASIGLNSYIEQHAIRLNDENSNRWMRWVSVNKDNKLYTLGDKQSESIKLLGSIHVADVAGSRLMYLLDNRLAPEEVRSGSTLLLELSDLLSANLVTLKENENKVTVKPTAELQQRIEAGEIKSLGGVQIPSTPQQSGATISTEDFGEVETTFMEQVPLERDHLRADIVPYDPMQLRDPNRGSWELWDDEVSSYGTSVQVPETLYARDPRMDVQDGGVVGIDFGTKSTVVVYRDIDGNIQPMRIGLGEFNRDVRNSDFENPTVMQCIDIEHFEAAYGARQGRPFTEWKDMTVSHTAFSAWRDRQSSEDFFSFIGKLKQWAGNPEQLVRIRDLKGLELTLPPYTALSDEDFDPIERYAYYIGLYINNMHTGRIYLEYLLSFPVTYPTEVRNRLLASFERGLRQSLPATIVQDPEFMDRFSVEQGASEPAAYAVCALQEYQIRPADGESVLYGVFDFGGGTTDFDFGLWRRPVGRKERKYDFVLQQFGASGDGTLGGENLLELLAFETLKDKQNRETLLKQGIPFAMPASARRFPGSETLIRDSQEAHSNLRSVMEALRPLWETATEIQSEQAVGESTKDAIQVQLFDQNGKPVSGIKLHADSEKLKGIIRREIERGVGEFFDALLTVFASGHFQEKAEEIGPVSDQICLFLAGNSSKSAILQEVFQQKMEEYDSKYNEALEKKGAEPPAEGTKHFRLFYPLGTKESAEQMEESGIEAASNDDQERPTGKTGVAMGLVQCRKGSRIKVIPEVKEETEIPFGYWVGDAVDGWLEPVLSRAQPYGQWVEYIEPDVDRIEFYYTSNPSAGQRMRSSEAVTARLRLPKDAVNEDWMVCLRPVSPNEIEYVVAETVDAANKGEFKSEVQQFMLSKG